MVERVASKQPPCESGEEKVRLPPRQREILALVAEGATDNEIARRLGLSSSFVSQYMVRIRARLGACSRAHAVAIALRHGILPNDPLKVENR